ncbi:hypothetical protein MVEG_07110 [Podila verticillata NRRL 6337]|nr:hypothetical protein MVEG_07110 [Podila verticillata NRRL 6337]
MKLTSSTVLGIMFLFLLTTSPCTAQSISEPTDPSGGPGTVASSDFVFNNQRLFLSDGGYNAREGPADTDVRWTRRQLFYSLDLSVPWPSSRPAWTKLARQPNKASMVGDMALSKDGSVVYFFDGYQVQLYNVAKDEWGSVANLTTVDMSLGVRATDTDSGVVIALRDNVTGAPDGVPSLQRAFRLTFNVFDPATNGIVTEGVDTLERVQEMVYSSERKSLFLLGYQFTLHEYNLAAKTYTSVVVKGNTSKQLTADCFASAYNGKNLVALGSLNSSSLDQITRDVFVFDVASSAWFKVSETPVGHSNGVCAISGDMLVLYGGFQTPNAYPKKVGTPNSNAPSIFNLKDKVWVDTYVPTSGSGSGGTSSSGLAAGVMSGKGTLSTVASLITLATYVLLT